MAAWLVCRHAFLTVLAATAVLASATLLFTPGLRHDYRLEAFIAGHDETYRTFRRFMDEFSSNEVAVIAYRTENAVSPSSLQMAGGLIDRVHRLEAVQNVVAVAAFPDLVRRLMGDRLYAHPLVQDTLVSRDRRTAAIILQMAGESGQKGLRRATVDALRAIVAEARRDHPEIEIHLAGPYVTLMDMYDYVDRDLLVFSVAAFVLLFITLALVFRRPGPMLYALAVSISATVCTLGLSVALGIVASLITQMIVILITVLSVATCVHLAVAVDETARRRLGGMGPRSGSVAERPEGGMGPPQRTRGGAPEFASWRDAALAVLGWMHRPCTAMVLTTVVGFASVCISTIAPIRSFGLLMAVGLMLSLGMSYLGCVLLVRATWRRNDADESAHAARSGVRLARLAHGLARRQGTVLLVALGVALLCAAGMTRLRFESDFVKNFRPASEVRRGYEFVEKNLAPVGSVEIVVRRQDGAPLAIPDAARQAHDLGRQIVDRFPTIRKALTLADVLDHGLGALPQDAAEIDARLAWARMAYGDDLLRGFINSDRTAMRINLRAVEGVNVGDKLRINREIQQMAEAAFGPDHHVTVTGLYHFYAHLIAGLLRSQYVSFGLTLPGVFLMLGWSFRSVRIALLAMAPNLPPMLLCLGVMGWTGIPVNMTTAMMLSVSFGIAVDDAIHYLWRFRHEFARRGDYGEALVASHASVGRACVIVTLTVAGGFWILMLSQFLPTAYFGALIGVTMAGALAADLLLLPVLIMLLRPFGPAQSRCARPKLP